MPRLKEEDILELIKITPEQVEKLDYETAMERLEMVTSALEQEGTPLALGLKLYELGTALSKKCAAVLDSTEEKMLQLLGDVKNQSEAPFDPEKDGR
ncbi:MAG: exodeoxyribonuclease VII small subunit [Candidatus Riflebacteria bacterium HGW-Riflebacteria-1]|jgi:exodeoxyribonuclease VII small subunit|nr:MAG: exodeoxyribonuclease VII small subunit [Candidatus Riflebacteria bacterium HGW-Riflebacteria-1]